MSTVEKIALALVTAGMFYTAVAPENTTVKLVGAIDRLWNTSLKTVTGQV